MLNKVTHSSSSSPCASSMLNYSCLTINPINQFRIHVCHVNTHIVPHYSMNWILTQFPPFSFNSYTNQIYKVRVPAWCGVFAVWLRWDLRCKNVACIVCSSVFENAPRDWLLNLWTLISPYSCFHSYYTYSILIVCIINKWPEFGIFSSATSFQG